MRAEPWVAVSLVALLLSCATLTAILIVWVRRIEQLDREVGELHKQVGFLDKHVEVCCTP